MVNWLYFIIGISWICLWVYWITAAIRTGLMNGSKQHHKYRLALLFILIAFLLLFARISQFSQQTFQHQPFLKAIAVVIFYSGLVLAVWARRTLGKNWGLPMSVRSSSNLITSGPYRLVRHPIYTALNLMMLGTAIIFTWAWAAVFVLGLIYAVYSAYQEEKNLAKRFPKEYPGYKKSTKMFVPYLI